MDINRPGTLFKTMVGEPRCRKRWDSTLLKQKAGGIVSTVGLWLKSTGKQREWWKTDWWGWITSLVSWHSWNWGSHPSTEHGSPRRSSNDFRVIAPRFMRDSHLKRDRKDVYIRRKDLFICVCLCAYMGTVCRSSGGQKRALNHLELEF